MRTIEAALLGATGVVVVLQSPSARQAAARGVVRAGRAAGPVAAKAAGRARQSATARYGSARTSLFAPAPGGPTPCTIADCDWTQPAPSAAELLAHIHEEHGAGLLRRRRPTPVTTAKPAPAEPAPARRLRPVPAPAERFTEVAPGVRIGHQIAQVIDKIGLHMDEFRSVTRAMSAAGEVEPKGLLGLLEAMTGLQATLASTANLITDITEHADAEMWVDMRVIAPMYEAASTVAAETQTIRKAMGRLRDLYAAQIEVEQLRESGEVRPLNPKVVVAA